MLRPKERGVLLLENLSAGEKNDDVYTTFDKTKPMPMQYMKLALESIARFHGVFWNYLRLEKYDEGMAPSDIETLFRNPRAYFGDATTVKRKMKVRLSAFTFGIERIFVS